MGKRKRTSQLAKTNYYKKKQEKYLSKKRNEEWKQIPKKLSVAEFNDWKDKLDVVASEANKRIELIKSAGYTSYALNKVEHEAGRDYFDLSTIENREDLLTEMTKMRVFMNDKGSTIEGAKLETAQINTAQYKGKFGNQYNNKEHGFLTYDKETIDPNVAKRAFESYRKIEEDRAGEVILKKGYGSENLIIALYDAEIRGKDSLLLGMDLLDTFIETHTNEWKRATEQSNSVLAITGIIEDNINRRNNF